jgi:glycosyltransferase involved in cell wall biosynthesis
VTSLCKQKYVVLSGFCLGGLVLHRDILISVIIPAFNACRTIADTLGSVVASFGDDPRVEVIVVDDGSEDGTSEIARSWSAKFPSFQIICQKNRGVAAARNNGVRASRGAWIYFIDSDDLINPAAGTQLLRLSESRGETGRAWLSFGFSKFIDGTPLPEARPVVIEFETIDFFSLNPLRFPICVGSVLVEREALLATGLFNPGETIGEDLEVWTKLGASHKLHHCRDVLLYYRQPVKAGVTTRERGYRDIFPAIRWLLDRGMWTANQARFIGSYAVLNLYVLKRSSASGAGVRMNELVREVGRVSLQHSCRLAVFRLMPLFVFDVVRRMRRSTPVPFIVTSDVIARSHFFQFLLHSHRIVSPSVAEKWLPEGRSVHLDGSWRAWPRFASGLLTRDRVSKYAAWSGVDVAEAECILGHRLVRGYARAFDKVWSLSSMGAGPVLALLPGDTGILRRMSRHAGGEESTFRLSPGVVLASFIMGLYSLIHDFLRVGSACAKAVRFSCSAWARGLARQDLPRGWDVLFLGHRQSGISDPDKLSELCFWSEVQAHVNAGPTLVRPKVVLLSGVKSPGTAMAPGIDVIPDLLSLPVVLDLREVLGLWISIGRVFISPSLFFSFGDMADEVMAGTCALALRKGGFRVVFTTNTNYQGDPVIEAVRKCRIPRANLYYSTNSRLLPSKKYPAPVDNPAWKMSGDAHHFSWNDDMDAWLENGIGIEPAKIIRSCPLMFASTETIRKPVAPLPARRDEIQGDVTVGLFDITPLTVSRGFDLGLGRTDYPQELCLQFFRDAVAAAREVFGDRVTFLVKFKRAINLSAHDRDYVAELGKVLDPLGNRVVRLAPDSNPWTALTRSNYVVGMPFTSMVDAAAWLGLPAVFFFPDQSLEEQNGRRSPLFSTFVGLRDWFASTDRGCVQGKDESSVAPYHVARFIEAKVTARQEVTGAV